MKTQFTLQAGRCIVRDGVPFASIHGVGQYDPCEVDKLAREVAALPDLVAALDKLHLAVTMRPSGNGGLSQSERIALDQARAALAKVKG